MKILHTADWHLGKMLYKYDLQEDMVHFFDWLVEYIEAKCIDVLLVSGDIFDLANPSNRDIKLYYGILHRLYQKNTKVIITGGNHDSIGMLEAPKDFLDTFQITVVGGIPDDRDRAIIPIYDATQQLQSVVLAVPFLRDRDLRKSVEISQAGKKSELERNAISALYGALVDRALELYGNNVPIIAMGHLHLQGAETSDSEREIHIGNLGGIGEEVLPSRIDYVALGHIHKQQKVGKTGKIRYSGSPIFLDFSERNYDKMLVELEVIDQKIQEIKVVKIPKNRELIKFKGNMDEIKQYLGNYTPKYPLTSLVEVEIIEDNYDPRLVQYQSELSDSEPSGNYKIIKTRLEFKNKLNTEDLFLDAEQIASFSPVQLFRKRIEVEDLADDLKEGLLLAYQNLLQEMND